MSAPLTQAHTPIDLNNLTDAPLGCVQLYVVYENHTLGYIVKVSKNHFQMFVLRTSVLKGSSLNPFTSAITVTNLNLSSFRKATIADFVEFRVSAKGYVEC